MMIDRSAAFGGPLLPSQQRAVDALKALLADNPLIAFGGAAGNGRTTILRALVDDMGGALFGAKELVEILDRSEWDETMEPIYDHVRDLLASHPVVVIDDTLMMSGHERGSSDRSLMISYFRPDWLDRALHGNGKLILAGDQRGANSVSAFGEAALVFDLPPLSAEDYELLLTRHIGDGHGIDFDLVHRHAASLNHYQLDYIGRLLRGRRDLTALGLIEAIEQELVGGAVRIEEVEELDFASLPGTEEIAEALETHVVLPFEHKEAAARMGLRASRGVLLYGPPGTGKTSIGRALARRMKGKFFLLDGNFVTEPPRAFFAAVESLVTAAKAAAPSILFVDDADVLFQIEHIAGLSRYLLSLLDGIESETAGDVCVVMTAMDARKIPEALLRSGRVELWLETRAPDFDTRVGILRRWTPASIPEFEDFDAAAIAAETDGFTPADLRRLSSEAKLLYAADIVAAKKIGRAEDYFREAVAQMLDQRDIMAERLADETLRIRPYV